MALKERDRTEVRLPGGRPERWADAGDALSDSDALREQVRKDRVATPLSLVEDPVPAWQVLLIVGVLPVLLLATYYRFRFTGLLAGDALDFAQLGRNLVQGRGFVTYILRPLALTHGGDPFNQPEVTHGPLFPMLLALAFGVLGARDGVAAGMSGLFYLLCIPVLAALGTRLFNRRVGLLSALLFAVNSQVLEYAISGMHLTLVIFLTTLALLVFCPLAETAPKPEDDDPDATLPALPLRSLIRAGLLTGALYLTEPLCIWFLPCFLVAVFRRSADDRWRRTLYFLAVNLLIALPWLARNATLTGNPLFGLRGAELWMSGDQPITLAYRLAPDALAQGGAMLLPVLRKIGLGLDQVLAALPTLTGVWLIGAVLPSLLFPPAPATARVRGITLWCLFLLLLGSVLTRVDMPLFVSVIPALIVYGVSYLQYLSDVSPLPRPAVRRLGLLLTGVVLYPLIATLTVRAQPAAPAEARAARGLERALPEKDVVLSDQPWLVAWNADRPAIWLPASDAHLPALREQFPSARWLFLTPETRVFSAGWSTLYDVFSRWTAADAQAAAAGAKRPPAVGIRVGDPDPLFSRLGGLSVTRLDGQSSGSAVVASFPKEPPGK